MIPLIADHFIELTIIPAQSGGLDNATGYASPTYGASFEVLGSPQPVPGEEILNLNIGEKVQEVVEFIFDPQVLNTAYEGVGLQTMKPSDKILYNSKEYEVDLIEEWAIPLQLSHTYVRGIRLRESY